MPTELPSPAARLARGNVPAYAVWYGAALYAVLLTAESVRKYRTFHAGFDLAHYDQLLWLMSHGKEPFSTIVTRPMLADHFQPAVALLAPAYWIGAGCTGILAAQSIALALTAPALFVLARAAGAPCALASIPALAWLVCPWVAAANLFEFHPAAFSPVLLVLSVFAVIRERHVLLFATTLLALSLKEDIALMYVVLGILLIFQGRRRVGTALAVGASLWLVVAVAILESFGAAYANYERRFAGDRGNSIGDVARWALTHPLQTLADVAGHGLLVLGILLIATFGLAFLAPSWILLGAPTVLHNATSAYTPQHGLYYHYHLGAMTGVFIAAAMGAHRVAPLRHAIWLTLLVPLAAAISLVGGLTVHESALRLGSDERVAAQSALDRIPSVAPVSASSSLLAHLSERAEVYSLPEPFIPVDWGSTLSARQFAERARRVRFVAYTDGDILPTGGFAPAKDVATATPLLRRLGFIEIARVGSVHVLERSETGR